ncbi:MAG: right-handed parallel beta-helix repeat-containing protein, partial [Thermoguttaceae bacterium]|nr:right-handed parallel beta-helix repeat-containing protein [Thermoguttaceae bacterium]
MSKSLKAVFVFCFVLVLCSGCPDRQVSEPVPAAPKLDKIVVPDDMPDLENAIARIAENGTIEIKPGKYLFKVPNRIGHNITITGTTDNPDDVVLECLNNSVFLIVADKAVIRNMTLHTIGIDSTVNLIAGASELSHCKISADKYASVFVTGASNATVSDCELTGSQNGVLVQTGSVTVRNCDISNMTEHGVAVTRAEGSVTVIDSKIS